MASSRPGARRPHTLLSPTLTNWGYISFFGCIAALVTFLFFAISQVKLADEARQQNASPVGSSSVVDERTSRQLVEPPFTYRNNELGLSIDYSPLVVGVDVVRQEVYEPDGYDGVAFVEEVKREGRESLFGPKLQITWVRDPRSLDQYEVDERARLAALYSMYPDMVRLRRLIINGIDGLYVVSGDGECGSNSYIFLHNGNRINIEAQCTWSESAFSEALQTLRFE